MIGVEEEYFLVDSQTRMPEPAGARVARLASEILGDLVSGEFTQYPIEVKTPPCADATQLREQLLQLRSAAAAAAAAEGLQIYAVSATVSSRSALTSIDRTSNVDNFEFARMSQYAVSASNIASDSAMAVASSLWWRSDSA